MRRTLLLLLIASLTPTSTVFAEVFANHASSRVDYTDTSLTATKRCTDLVAQSNFEFTLLSAKLIDAHEDVPTHCRLTGLVPSEVRFEVNLPQAWNGRLYMYGNGGLAGTPATDPGKQLARDQALRHGFATAYTDTGHDRRVQPGGTFAQQNLHKLVDYGFRAVHLSVVSAKQLTQIYYGQTPHHSYWNGCSTGGRQGMIAAQRFPADFDGIIAGAPAADYSGLKFSQAWRVSAISNSGLTEDEVLELAKHIYAACDDKDGAADGLIADPRRCNFDVDRDLPHCRTQDTKACFDATERAALKRYYAPVVLAGEEVYPAMPVGSEVMGATFSGSQRTGWYPWLINSDGPVLLDLLGSDFFRYMAFIEDRPEFDWTQFDFATEPDNLAEFRDIVDAVSPDLSAYKAQGGKLLTYFGWADPDINPLTLLNYYAAVGAQDETVADYFRVFMVPGMFHCRGGAGPDRFDAMTPLIEWVETGTAPSEMPVWRHQPNGKRADTRKICAHPAEASAVEAGRWQCQQPRESF